MTNNRVDLNNIKEGHFELRLGRQNRISWDNLTSLVQSVSMGFLRVQRTLGMSSIVLLGGLRHAPRKILKLDIMRLNLEAI